MTHWKRQLNSIPEGEPVGGASVIMRRASDETLIAQTTTDEDGWAELLVDGNPGEVIVTTSKGSTKQHDDSRQYPRIGRTWHSLKRLMFKELCGDGVIPTFGSQFAVVSSGGGSVTLGTGAVLLDGVIAVWRNNKTLAVADGDMAIAAKLVSSDGRIELVAIAYASLGTITSVPLWRLTMSGGVLAASQWIGAPILHGIISRHPALTSETRLSSGSTTSASGEDAGLSTTLTLADGVEYEVIAKASVISRGRAGAIAVQIDGNLSAYRGNGGDITCQFMNAHSRTITGSGAAITIKMFDRSDTLLTDWVLQGTFGSFGSGTSPNFNTPGQVAVDSSGNVYIADTANNRLVKLNSSGAYVSSITGLTGTTGVCVDSSGNVYVVYDTGLEFPSTHNIRKYNSAFVAQWTVGASGVRHLTTDGTHLYVTIPDADRVVKYLCTTGASVTFWGSSGSGNGQFNYPWGIATDGTHVYVVDGNNDRVQKFTAAGAFVTKWGSQGTGDGFFSAPHGAAIDASGDVWVADFTNDRLQRFSNVGAYQTQIPQANPDGIAIATGDVLWASNVSSHNVAKWDETALSFNWDAGLLMARAIPRS